MAVKYKYTDESEVVYSDADNFTLKINSELITQWQAFGTYQHIPSGQQGAFISQVVTTNSGSVVEKPLRRGTFKGAPIIGYFWRLETPDGLVDITPKGEPGEDIDPLGFSRPFRTATGSMFIPETYTRWSFLLARIKPRNENLRDGYRMNEPFVEVSQGANITYWHPAGGQIEWILKIFEGEEEVFSRTEGKRPEYVQIVDGRGCPPNSCPVKCGDNVCCYGSDGIAVEAFPYEESIYATQN